VVDFVSFRAYLMQQKKKMPRSSELAESEGLHERFHRVRETAGGNRERADLLFRRSALLYALSEYLKADAITLDLVDNVVYDLGHGCKKALDFGALLGKRILSPGERSAEVPAPVRLSEGNRGLTETEGLNSVKPSPMLAHVFRSASERKLRLFAAACCRRIWPWLADNECRQAVEVAEKHADRQATQAALTRAAQSVRRLRDREVPINTAQEAAAEAAACAASDKRNELVDTASNAAMCAAIAASGAAQADAGSGPLRETFLKALAAEQAAQCSLLREIFGNPFRPVNVNLAWKTPEVTSLANAIYESQDFGRLPTLARVLRENGCPITKILEHLEEPTQHVRGCWALDLLVGKS